MAVDWEKRKMEVTFRSKHLDVDFFEYAGTIMMDKPIEIINREDLLDLAHKILEVYGKGEDLV